MTATKTGRIGVLATAGTIASGAYVRAVAQLSTRAEVIGQAAPLLVPLAEEGWTQGEVPRLVVRRYVEPLAEARVDVVRARMHALSASSRGHRGRGARLDGPGVAVVDSAKATAEETRAFLEARGLLRPGQDGRRGVARDGRAARPFSEVAARFLGDDAPEVEQVDL